MVLFFGFKSGAFPVHIRVTKPLAYHAASVGRKKKKKMKRRGDSEARRGNPKFRTSQRLYIEWTRRLPYRSAPVGLCHSLFFSALAAAWNHHLPPSARCGGSAARGGASGWHNAILTDCQSLTEAGL
jgi:hypothetical protein